MDRLLEEIRAVLAWHSLSFLGNGSSKWLVYLLALVEPLDVTGLQELCRRLSSIRASPPGCWRGGPRPRTPASGSTGNRI